MAKAGNSDISGQTFSTVVLSLTMPPQSGWGRQAETEKAENADGDDGVADAQAGIDDQHARQLGSSSTT
jgi:hypothetical protein